MLIAVLSGFALALIAPWISRFGRRATGWLLALLPSALTVVFARQLWSLVPGEAVTRTYAWIPSLGLTLSFYADGLSLLFALLISGIGALVIVYAGGYLAGHPHLRRFYVYILLFMAAMLGVVLADNLLTMFVFWELTSLSSYLLIGFEHEREEARAAALQALLVTGSGGLALLAGIILLGQASGSLELSVLLSRGDLVRSHRLYLPILLLVLAGAFTKSAQMPFHFWLPNAMEAPTPVSAYLHSATMVKAGIYLLARLSPVLGGTGAWYGLLLGFGGVTMLVSAYMALRQTDLKRILAYSTVSALGTLTLLLGLGTRVAAEAAMAYLCVHALYKGGLFLVAGAIEHSTGTRDVRQLGGLGHRMGLTAVAAGLAALSMAGLPPLLGFIAKELLYEAVWHMSWGSIVTIAAVLTNMAFVAVAGLVGMRPFWGRVVATPSRPHEAPPSMWLGPLLLAGMGLVAGLWPLPTGQVVLTPAVVAIHGHAETMRLVLWHGWNPSLLLSIVTVAGGVALYLRQGSVQRVAAALTGMAQWGPVHWYARSLVGLNAVAGWQTRLLQSGYLRYYLLLIFGTAVGLAGYTLLHWGILPGLSGWTNVRFYEAWLAGLILVASLAAVRARTRLTAIAAMGVVGYGVSLIYILFGAPDLAMTQFLVETLTVILFVLVFYHLPGYTLASGTPTRLRDLVIVLTVGTLIAALVLLATQVQWYPTIAAYFASHSLPNAHGHNIVNVILVDFRGFDTMGEITVLAVAGLGVYALLKLRIKRGEQG